MIKRTDIPAFTFLLLGLILLAFTFINAYLFLQAQMNISAASDLVMVFGLSLAPLIETGIRVMYLGVMGWIGSVLTIRGIQLETLPRNRNQT